MLVIRRLVDRRRAYTAIFLPGDPPRIFPTTDAEHARILQIYLQDKPYEGVVNDFTRLSLAASGDDHLDDDRRVEKPPAARRRGRPTQRARAK